MHLMSGVFVSRMLAVEHVEQMLRGEPPDRVGIDTHGRERGAQFFRDLQIVEAGHGQFIGNRDARSSASRSTPIAM